MRAILQRVKSGQVSVEGEVVGEIEAGYVILLGVTHGDGPEQVKKLAEKTANLRVFEDEQGKMNRSALDVGAEMLVISQFTLFADVRKGTKPSFSRAAAPDHAEKIYLDTVQMFEKRWPGKVQAGIFAAEMKVELCNEGPVTLIVDRD